MKFIMGSFYKRKNLMFNIVELCIWILVGVIVSFPLIVYGFHGYGDELERIIFENYGQTLISIFMLIFPILFKLIFGNFPIESLRNRRIDSKEISKLKNEMKYNNTKENNCKEQSNKKDDKVEDKEEIHILLQYVIEANSLANKIYNRAGVYLLVGCLIAFGGILIFYSPIFGDALSVKQETSMLSIVISYIPRFGAMIFIEVIAFFFLKQYKIMMEEFRYYERIKRRRQDNFAVFNLVKEFNEESDLKKILENCKFEESNSRLLNGETTEVLEVSKQADNDLKVFDRIIELIKTVKSDK
ncbi:hypothetical protein [Bacillus cereus]|uniref:hypothetical protein n=1 Tax=Bacillus cereus TaxID=1396 RepID=UPI000BF43852|nr:hypothetical protein [Bacillus cereus]PEV31075.1 hypothetical protein CN430_02965 [Bacillus cereus]PEY47861.1 hypothetical protein CN348_24570 [Bacillus cereus]PFE33573.1 hypothetical protein CN294_29670 [Bacillus cereus]PFK43700.1 hypothetical protein COJ20_06770 [Bacillus cereus]HDX9683735.1 hypothetical protein [Bacillus cereus]